MSPRKKFKMAFVTWIDACHSEEYSTEEELKENRDYIVHSAGILVASNRHHIALSQDYIPVRDDYRVTKRIPRKYVTALSVVEVVGEKEVKDESP